MTRALLAGLCLGLVLLAGLCFGLALLAMTRALLAGHVFAWLFLQ